MWIRTQNRQRIVNTDQVIDIFVNNAGTKIYANTTVGHHEPGDTSQFILGEYKDRETCLMVLDDLFATCLPKSSTYRMPLGGEVE